MKSDWNNISVVIVNKKNTSTSTNTNTNTNTNKTKNEHIVSKKACYNRIQAQRIQHDVLMPYLV